MIWLFDYDLTLYGADEAHVLGSLDRNISRFVSEKLGISLQEADVVRRSYWERFGTTLGGLSALHGIPPNEYFDYIHHGEGLQMPRPSEEMHTWLRALPGSCWVFTNARHDWAERGLQAMEIADCFAGLIDLEALGWKGKPSPEVYPQVERLVGASGSDIVFYEDKLENLQPARERGWVTVLVHPHQIPAAGSCDAVIPRLPDLAYRERLRG